MPDWLITPYEGLRAAEFVCMTFWTFGMHSPEPCHCALLSLLVTEIGSFFMRSSISHY